MLLPSGESCGLEAISSALSGTCTNLLLSQTQATTWPPGPTGTLIQLVEATLVSNPCISHFVKAFASLHVSMHVSNAFYVRQPSQQPTLRSGAPPGPGQATAEESPSSLKVSDYGDDFEEAGRRADFRPGDVGSFMGGVGCHIPKIFIVC